MAAKQESLVTIAMAILPREFLFLACNLSCFAPNRIMQ